MKRYPSSRAFTIIELLVVVSIIALLVGILLPAIGKAREQANLTRSQANITQLGKAAVTYAAEFADRQLTFCNDSLSKYGTTAASVGNYYNQTGYQHPPVILGYAQNGIWGYYLPPIGGSGNWATIVPLDFQAAPFGSFRFVNARQFNTYLNGRFYDPSMYAPKDTAVYASVEEAFNHPDEYADLPGDTPRWSSYCFSPAAMFSPDVFSKIGLSTKYFNNPWSLPSGFRSPAMSQAQYSSLKTHVIEHNWCQNRKKVCNPFIVPPTFDGCEPYYFNASWDSSPVSLFYDGHVGSIGCRDAMADNLRVTKQTGDPDHGLWSRHTPLGGSFADGGGAGYYSDQSVDWTSTSFHILTTDGIKGRDMLPKS